MNCKKAVSISIDIALHYAKNNSFQDYYDFLDENVYWFGNREGQFVHGKKELIKVLDAEPRLFDITVSNIISYCVPAGSSGCSIMLEYSATIYINDAKLIIHKQHAQFVWTERVESDPNTGKRVKRQKIVMISVASLLPSDARENPRAMIPDRRAVDNFFPRYLIREAQRISFNGENNNSYIIESSNIMYIENTNNAKHTLVHLAGKTIRATCRLSYFTDNFPNIFMKPHSSYIVNPHYIQAITRFKLTLINGQILSIPEKKYTRFKKDFEAWVVKQR